MSVKHIHSLTSGRRPSLIKMIDNLKMMVDDAQFTNPWLTLRQLNDRFILQMQNESNDYRRQTLADKCVAYLCAEIDAIAITFDKGLCERDLFTKMKSLTSETSNTLLTDVVYFGRLANANAIAGRFDESEDMLRAARCKAFHIGPCRELLVMFYIEVQVRLYSFDKTPTADARRSLLRWGRMGLQYAEQVNLDGKKAWRRSFVLRMVFCLLGLGNTANIIENCHVDETCIVEAKELLANIDRNWTGIKTRRQMLYHVARGRIAELTEQYQDCLNNLRISMHLAREGQFFELEFISNYCDKVKTFHQRLKTNSILTFDDDETIPKLRLYSPVSWNSTSNVALLRLPSDEDTHPSVKFRLKREEHNIFQEKNSQSVDFERQHDIVLLKSNNLSFSGKSNWSCTDTSVTVFKSGMSGRFCMESNNINIESHTEPKEIYHMQQMNTSFESEKGAQFPHRKAGETTEQPNADDNLPNRENENDYRIHRECLKSDNIKESNESKLSVRLPLSGRTSAANSDADSFTKPKCLVSSEHPYPTQEHLHGEDPHVIETFGTFETSELFMPVTGMENRIPPAGRSSAGNTPCQTVERFSDSQKGYQKEGHTSVEHLDVYQSFKESNLSDNLSSLDSDDMFGY
ncbi:uncharacterized protein LOC128226927 [Mya arenaria]|uniref:uncharacterized protein LOC128226927 n=1 Tax=Mya arenaria TaxID=6604 RepID=UPI0022E429CE|nr:uncharacterized protein LOC128226927 [Mya arenaria]